MKLVYKPFDKDEKINIAVASKQSLLNLFDILKKENNFDPTKGKMYLVDKDYSEEVIV